ncbi:methyltransferase [Fragilaria crotonensis]|nr:methyltransferase [Fragilaria crotonensis]
MTSDKRGFTFDFALDVGAIPVPAVGTNLLSIARDERGRSDFEFLKDISALMKEVSSQTLDSTIAVQLSDVQSLVKVLNPATSDEMIVDEIEREGTDIIPGFPLDHVANSVVLGAGDWLEMSRRLAQGNHEIPQLPSGGRFHLVLAAETTYTTESSEDTATLLAKHVAIDGMASSQPNATTLVAVEDQMR